MSMKAARLVSEIVILSARSVPITAANLAERLEVTERTVYRDLGDLSRMGVPVVTEAGPGGGISLQFGYAARTGSRLRTAIPLGLVVKAGRWYLIAQPPGGRPRTYRVSRMTAIALRYVAVSRPVEFHLGDYWSRSQVEFDRTVRSTTVRLRVPSQSLDDLRRAVPGRVTEEAIEAGSITADDYVIDLPMEPVDVAVSQLITVPGVEVISPGELRLALHERARQAAACNGP